MMGPRLGPELISGTEPRVIGGARLSPGPSRLLNAVPRRGVLRSLLVPDATSAPAAHRSADPRPIRHRPPAGNPMDITAHSSRQSLIRWAERVRALVAAHGDADAVAAIDQAIAQHCSETF